jgi:hypothetical protein
MTIDINKKYKTRDGQDVRIYAVDGNGPYPVHGAVEPKTDFWIPESWTPSGKTSCKVNSSNDLVEVKPRIKQKMWVNVYPDHCLGAYHEKRHADEMAAPHRIGCVQVEIECEEGEGL